MTTMTEVANDVTESMGSAVGGVIGTTADAAESIVGEGRRRPGRLIGGALFLTALAIAVWILQRSGTLSEKDHAEAEGRAPA